MSRIEKFYTSTIDENTAVVTIQHLKQQLEYVQGFDWDEFNKPLYEIDMKKVADSAKDSGLAGKWKQMVAKGQKPGKQAISKYTLDKSTTMGLGSGTRGNTLLIRGLKSKFAGHPYKFGNYDEQNLLKSDLQEIVQQRKEYYTAVEKSDNTDPCYSKKMCTVGVEFDICSQDQAYQSDEVLEQIKYLSLIQYLIAYQVTCEVLGGSPRDSKAQVKVEGCLKNKFDEYAETEVIKAKITVDAIPLYHNSKACDLVQVDRPNEYFDETAEVPLYEALIPATMNEWVRLLSRYEMDMILVIDSCAVKKTGNKVEVMPKIKAVQTVIRKEQYTSKRHIGLKLVR